MRKSTKAVAIAAASIIFVGMGTAAFAYWTAEGVGTGGALTSSSEISDIQVVQSSIIDAMGPGVAPQTLGGTFTNSGGGPGYVAKVTVVIDSVDVDVNNISAGTCDEGDFVIVDEEMDVNQDVEVGVGVGTWGGATIAFVNDPAENQDICRGATVNLVYTIS